MSTAAAAMRVTAGVRRLPLGESHSSLTDTLRLEFVEVFQRDDITAEDDFFELGGDSLVAELLMTAVERDLEVVLPISTLIDAPTPSSLATLILTSWQKIPSSLVVPIHAAGHGPPLICVHGMRGDVVFARLLAIAVGAARPFYAIRAAGLADGERSPAFFDDMVRSYLAETAKIWRAEPCILMGHCSGSLIAHEMARRLRNAGQPIAGLILIDPPHTKRASPWLWHSGYVLLRRRARLLWRAVGHRSAMNRRRTSLSGADRRQSVRDAIMLATAAHFPKPYPGDTLLVHSTESRARLLDRKRGLPRFMKALEAIEVGRTHDSIFAQDVRDMASAINAFLQRVSPL